MPIIPLSEAISQPTEANMSSNRTVQQKANVAAFEDGRRCRLKGLGLKGDRYDYPAWDRMFERGFRAWCRGIDREECREEWREGWHHADDQVAARRDFAPLTIGGAA